MINLVVAKLYNSLDSETVIAQQQQQQQQQQQGSSSMTGSHR
jgi:hypothetical protein